MNRTQATKEQALQTGAVDPCNLLGVIRCLPFATLPREIRLCAQTGDTQFKRMRTQAR